MNEYDYDDIEIGHTESFSVVVTQDMLQKFCDITGDVNPMHCDDAFAQSKGMPSRIAYGMMTASFLSTLAGVYLPGRRSLIYETSVQFPNCVLVGDELTVTGTVKEKDDSLRALIVKVAIKNAKGKSVCRGSMTIGVTR